MEWNQLVGQDAAKGFCEFHIKAFEAGQPFTNTLFAGARGQGKTEIMTALASRLKKIKKGEKRAMLLNAASVKNLKQLWNTVIIPVVNDCEVTLCVDEAHKLPKDCLTAFLTILNPNKENKTSFTFEDYTVDFDFAKQTFLFATTDVQSLIEPFVNRLRRVDLEDYSCKDLGTILKRHAPDVNFKDNVVSDVATVLRGNARQATMMASDIKTYLAPLRRSEFNPKDWNSLKEQLHILPLGLSALELKVLTTLNDNLNCSLTRLGAKLMMGNDAVRRDLEIYLLKLGLIEIGEGSKRNLTPAGQEYLKALKGK